MVISATTIQFVASDLSNDDAAALVLNFSNIKYLRRLASKIRCRQDHAPRSERLIGGRSVERVAFVVDRWVDENQHRRQPSMGSLKLDGRGS